MKGARSRRGSDVKIVFFSSDRLEVERVSMVLAASGIACEVREGVVLENDISHPPEAEVWIKRDTELSRAFMICVKENIGFAKRETMSQDFDDIAIAA
jgi:hypothetical protein